MTWLNDNHNRKRWTVSGKQSDLKTNQHIGLMDNQLGTNMRCIGLIHQLEMSHATDVGRKGMYERTVHHDGRISHVMDVERKVI